MRPVLPCWNVERCTDRRQAALSLGSIKSPLITWEDDLGMRLALSCLDRVSCYYLTGPFSICIGTCGSNIPHILIIFEVSCLKHNIMLSSKAKENIDKLLASLIFGQLAVCWRFSDLVKCRRRKENLRDHFCSYKHRQGVVLWCCWTSTFYRSFIQEDRWE